MTLRISVPGCVWLLMLMVYWSGLKTGAWSFRSSTSMCTYVWALRPPCHEGGKKKEMNRKDKWRLKKGLNEKREYFFCWESQRGTSTHRVLGSDQDVVDRRTGVPVDVLRYTQLSGVRVDLEQRVVVFHVEAIRQRVEQRAKLWAVSICCNNLLRRQEVFSRSDTRRRKFMAVKFTRTILSSNGPPMLKILKKTKKKTDTIFR